MVNSIQPVFSYDDQIADRALQGAAKASGMYSGFERPRQDGDPGPTVGGAIMAGAGAAGTGAIVASMYGMSTPIGAGIGALAGIGAYLLS